MLHTKVIPSILVDIKIRDVRRKSTNIDKLFEIKSVLKSVETFFITKNTDSH